MNFFFDDSYSIFCCWWLNIFLFQFLFVSTYLIFYIYNIMWCQMAFFNRSGVCFHLTELLHLALKSSLIKIFVFILHSICCLHTRRAKNSALFFNFHKNWWYFFTDELTTQVDNIQRTNVDILKHQFKIARDLFFLLLFVFFSFISFILSMVSLPIYCILEWRKR